MQKIMFNDRFLLTQAVLKGLKTQTRRSPSTRLIDKYNDLVEEFQVASINVGVPCSVVSIEDFLLEHAPYKVGEIVAVAQRYSECGAANFDEWERNSDWFEKGFSNKMFVKPELMPHQIRITNVRVQRLQDITDDECLLEGIVKSLVCSYNGQDKMDVYRITENDSDSFMTPVKAYMHLIDAISGKGTWDSNPYVFVYDFELVR